MRWAQCKHIVNEVLNSLYRKWFESIETHHNIWVILSIQCTHAVAVTHRELQQLPFNSYTSLAPDSTWAFENLPSHLIAERLWPRPKCSPHVSISELYKCSCAVFLETKQDFSWTGNFVLKRPPFGKITISRPQGPSLENVRGIEMKPMGQSWVRDTADSLMPGLKVFLLSTGWITTSAFKHTSLQSHSIQQSLI